jgi:Ca2+-binding EF-hand superfamily protein
VAPCSVHNPPFWRDLLKLLIHQLPSPYAWHEWKEFWRDVDALLSASIDSHAITQARAKDIIFAKQKGSLDGLLMPSVFVSDRSKLFLASTETMFRSALAEASGLRDIDLLPVVLASDFKTLCGNLTTLPMAQVADSLVFGDGDTQIPSGSDQSTAEDEAFHHDRVPVSPGIYFQYCAEEPVTGKGQPSGTKPAPLGAQALGVFSDGQCAYAAVSADGLRCVQAIGTWDVINGQFVIGGSSGNAEVRHVRLVGVGQQEQVKDASYTEPIHLSLEDLTGFDFPTTLSECVPLVGQTLREELLKLRLTREKHCQVAKSLIRSPSRHGKKQTFAAGLEPLSPRSLGRSRVASESQSQARLSLGDSADLRGLLHGDEQPGSPTSLPSDGTSYRTCPLKPGTYSFEDGFQGDVGYRSLAMTLNVDGSYAFTESKYMIDVRLLNTSPHWSVEGGKLILGSRDASAYCFLRSEKQGTKDIEQRIVKIAIPVETVLKSCKFAVFPQQLDRFPGHKPSQADKCVCGLIDPASPALFDPPVELDRMPVRAVEAELHERGLNSDQLLSDLQHLDMNGDGMVGADDLEALKSYGKSSGSPEQLSELREALMRRFGNINTAFAACCKVAQGIDVTGEAAVEEDADEDAILFSAQRSRHVDSGIDCTVFEKFLHQAAVDTRTKKDKKKASKSALLEVWLEKNSSEEIQEVFASINIRKVPTIDLEDFVTLSLHTAMASMQRLAHFQSWIFQRFGRTQEHFDFAFNTLDQRHLKKFSIKHFIEALETFGYPCSTAVMHCIFGLLDRHFKGCITVQEFESLRSFNSTKLLRGLQDLQHFVCAHFGGIDECFQKLLKLEKIQRKLGGKAKSVCFKTFEKAFTQGGFKQAYPGADLEMLFLFLDEASDQSTSGCLTYMEWQLLRGFESRAVAGSPARLRRFLEQQFGNMEEAYKILQASWQARVVRERLTQAALNGLVRAMRSIAHDARNPNFGKSGWGNTTASTVNTLKAANLFKGGGTSDNHAAEGAAGDAAKVRRTSSKVSPPKADVEVKRPHTHEGTRNRFAVNAKGSLSARRPASRGTTYSLPSETPRLPRTGQLATELWQPRLFPKVEGAEEAPQSARCRSAPSGDQKAFGNFRAGSVLASAAPEPRCKLQATETQPGFTGLNFAFRARSQASSDGGWTSSQRRALSAINWSFM